MARFRKIETDFWNDAFIEERTPEDRYFFIFLLTNPYTKQCGIYEITHKKIADLLGYDRSVIKSLIERFEGYGKIKYNDDTKEMCIINWGKYNLTRGGKPILDCVKSELKSVKDKTLIEIISQSIENEQIRSVFDAFLIENDVSSTLRGQEKEEEEEKEEKEEKKEDAPDAICVTFDIFKEKILANINNVSFDFEIGYCKKKRIECLAMDQSTEYFDKCIEFLFSLKEKNKPEDFDGENSAKFVALKNEAPTPLEVGRLMAEYYNTDLGRGQLETMCFAAGNVPIDEALKFIEPLCVKWALKQQAYTLINWRKETAGLSSWIENKYRDVKKQANDTRSNKSGFKTSNKTVLDAAQLSRQRREARAAASGL